jgi:hypothetical protein
MAGCDGRHLPKIWKSKEKVEKDTERVIRMRSNLEQDKILLKTQEIWNIANNRPDFPI